MAKDRVRSVASVLRMVPAARKVTVPVPKAPLLPISSTPPSRRVSPEKPELLLVMVRVAAPSLVRLPLPLIAPLMLLFAVVLLIVRVPEERVRLPGEVRELI